MLPRLQKPVKDASLQRDVRKAQAIFERHGWSLRSAAPVLGCHWMHLHKVLSGERRSARLVAKIIALPPRPKPQRMKPLKKAA